MLSTYPTTESTWSSVDLVLMDLAFVQAGSASGRVAPNPAVGAVIARRGEVLGIGATQPPPGPHAEVVALREAGDGARGADLYVTLEPCSHTGRTPPCVDAIIEAGIARVIVATLDPNPLVNGRGIERLRAAGISVDIGCRADAGRKQIAGFVCRIQHGRPQTLAKYAMTLDGRIATFTGHSRWISGEASRRHVHMLRDRTDAILVGIGTLLADDPQLTTRLPDDQTGYGGPHHPLRVVLDSQLRTPVSARMLADYAPGQTLIYTTDTTPTEHQVHLEAARADIVRVPAGSDGHVDIAAVLRDLGDRGLNDLLIEGGGAVLGAFFEAGLVDRVAAYVAPVIVGGRDAPGPVGGRGVATMPEAWRLVDRVVTQLGDDVLITGRVARDEETADV